MIDAFPKTLVEVGNKMARITVEDCLENVNNRFELVMLAAKRARQLMRGSVDPTVAWENDKATVVALREIAHGHTDFSDAHEIDRMPVAAVAVEAATITFSEPDDEEAKPETDEPSHSVDSESEEG